METTDAASLVSTAFANFGAQITEAAPALLGIGILAFGIGYIWRFAKRLVS